MATNGIDACLRDFEDLDVLTQILLADMRLNSQMINDAGFAFVGLLRATVRSLGAQYVLCDGFPGYIILLYSLMFRRVWGRLRERQQKTNSQTLGQASE